MKINPNYKGEYLALRYGLVSHTSDMKTKCDCLANLLKLSTTLGWQALPDDLLTHASSVTERNTIKNIFPNLSAKTNQMNSEQDNFFGNLLTHQIESKKEEIIKHCLSYYKKGNFTKYNTTFMKYVRNLKGINEMDMNDLVTKYFISSIIMNREKQTIDDYSTISKNYCLYDYNIYRFLIKLLNGEFSGMSNIITHILKNISDETFKLIPREDLAFYFAICLLLDYDKKAINDMISNIMCLGCDFFDSFPDYFSILKNYQKCQFKKVVDLMEGYIKKFESDQFLFLNIEDIFKVLKMNILKSILSSVDAVKISDLKDILKIKSDTDLEEMIIKCIEVYGYDFAINDIEGIVCRNERDPIDEEIKVAMSVNKKNMAKMFKFVLNNAIRGNYRSPSDKKSLMKFDISREEAMLGLI